MTASSRRSPPRARTGLVALLALWAIGGCERTEEEAPAPQEYEAALVSHLVQLADEELSERGEEAGPYCVARVDDVDATTSRDPSDAVLAPASAGGRRVHPVSACGSFERPTVDGEPATLILLQPVEPAAPDTVVGGYATPAGAPRYFSCPVAGLDSGVRLGVCRAHSDA